MYSGPLPILQKASRVSALNSCGGHDSLCKSCPICPHARLSWTCLRVDDTDSTNPVAPPSAGEHMHFDEDGGKTHRLQLISDHADCPHQPDALHGRNNITQAPVWPVAPDLRPFSRNGIYRTVSQVHVAIRVFAEQS